METQADKIGPANERIDLHVDAHDGLQTTVLKLSRRMVKTLAKTHRGECGGGVRRHARSAGAVDAPGRTRAVDQRAKEKTENSSAGVPGAVRKRMRGGSRGSGGALDPP